MARHANARSVLLVETAQDDRAMYAEYLGANGFRPLQVGDTGEALQRAAHADVVVTGIRVAGPFDGVELVHRLRRLKRTAYKPIIVLTACVFEPDRERALAAGCDVFLPKPCLPDTLVNEIRRVLALERVPKPPPEHPEHTATEHHRRAS